MFAKNQFFVRLLMSPPKVTLSMKRSIHNYDEIYAQTKMLFECKYSILVWCHQEESLFWLIFFSDGKLNNFSKKVTKERQ